MPLDEINIGFAEVKLPINAKPGHSLKGGQNFGVSSLGGLFNRCIRLFEMDSYHAGDIIGLGINFIKNELFITKNGVFISSFA